MNWIKMYQKYFFDKFLRRRYSGIDKSSTTANYKVSYAQCGEDCIVDFILTNVLNVEIPNFIDVGAHHPLLLSNTKMFYKKGGFGINIEPNPTLFKEFLIQRPNNINLNIGIDTARGVKDYYMFKESALNSFDPQSQYLPNRTLERIVPINLHPLSEIIYEYFGNKSIDFLSVDVEGLDLLVMESLDLKVNRPKVICIETIQEISKDEWARNNELIKFIEHNDYLLHSSTMINSIFIDKSLISVKLVL